MHYLVVMGIINLHLHLNFQVFIMDLVKNCTKTLPERTNISEVSLC